MKRVGVAQSFPSSELIFISEFSLLPSATMDSKTAPPLGEKTVIEVKNPSASNSIDITEAQGFDEKATKKLIRRIDWHLIPFLSLIYLYGQFSAITKTLLS